MVLAAQFEAIQDFFADGRGQLFPKKGPNLVAEGLLLFGKF
jgi:hypothetical protein